MERRTFIAGLAAASLPLVAGCGGGDGGGDGGASPAEDSTPAPTDSPTPAPTATPTATPTDSPTPTPTATPTPVPSAQEQYASYSWGKLEGVEPVGDASIRMKGFQFRPLVAAVTPGTEVTVTNDDSTTHSFAAPRLGVNRTLSGGDDISFTVERTGTFDYVCTFHPPDMLGRLVVADTTPTPAPTATPTPTPTETGGGGGDDDYY